MTSTELRTLFQNPFNLTAYTQFLHQLFPKASLRNTQIQGTTDSEPGYDLGNITTSDGYALGFIYYQTAGSVARRRVGLRKFVGSYINPTRGQFDAVLVAFSDGTLWRLSLVCDLKGAATAPRRFTFVFGDPNHLYRTAVDRFLKFLQTPEPSFDNLRQAFSVEALSKEFYGRLFRWYQWAMDPATGITFPNNPNTPDDDRENLNVKLIRLITRLLFVWFIKQENLVPKDLFDTNRLTTILRNFNPLSTTSGNYYNAILQNLFFATLNCPKKERAFANSSTRNVRNLYRDCPPGREQQDGMFLIPQNEVLQLFSTVPYLNGGLFDCLDKFTATDGSDTDLLLDGFSRNNTRGSDGHFKYRAFIPNILFFNNSEQQPGLIPLLSEYNFTIEENTTNDADISLDPELLGRVFENLLADYNPETSETARKTTGSFYTPRHIVDYMVDQSLLAYLHAAPSLADIDPRQIDRLFDSNSDIDPLYWTTARAQQVCSTLSAVKILDPACGSGAFPMGCLLRIVDIEERLLATFGPVSRYRLKLQLIRECIYGVDIQPIAMLISKLRFFISLVCDQEPDPAKPNYAIEPLPNLETKFVAANTLLALKKETQGNIFTNPQIDNLKQELAQVRHRLFSARSVTTKKKLRLKDKELRTGLAALLQANGEFAPQSAKQMTEWDPYSEREAAAFFDPEWMFGLPCGFDIVIGNPPYIQLQANSGKLSKLYKPEGFCSFNALGDIYCLFYERGLKLLRQGGTLCYITSNKWMRAGYGRELRTFLARQADACLLIDFAGIKVFESATVDTNILLLHPKATGTTTRALSLAGIGRSHLDSINIATLVNEQAVQTDFRTSEGWIVTSETEQAIRRKIEQRGKPLKDWDIHIYRGVLTGYNPAFIISTEKRNEILRACRTTDERQRTEQLIRPILRGRDIHRYSYQWANLWLIATHNGLRDGSLKRIDINDYPAVKAHLDKYWDKISTRDDQGATPYNLRNCAYWHDFEKEKIVWARLCRISRKNSDFPRFAGVEGGKFVVDSLCFFSGANLDVISSMLNSTYAAYWFLQNVAVLDDGGMQMRQQYVEKIPLPLALRECEAITDRAIYDAFGLTRDEQDYIEREVAMTIADILERSED